MIGQDKLFNTISSFTLNSFPRVSLFIGEVGCGKHELIMELAKGYHLPLEDISETLSPELLNEISSRAIQAVYLLNLDKITERQQNMILKTLEEPPVNALFMLTCSSKTNVLETVLNRCHIFEFEHYTKDILKQFVTDKENEEFILNVCSTPGQIKSLNPNYVKSLQELCNKVISRLPAASFSNTLSISNKINFKDEYDKFDLNIFLTALMTTLFTNFKDTNNKLSLQLYLIVQEYKKKFRDKRVDRKTLVDNLLTKMWKVSRKCY